VQQARADVTDENAKAGAPAPDSRPVPRVGEVRAALAKARIVSCDIFDTVLSRTLARPEDVHLLTGARALAAGLVGCDPAAFREWRIEAERAARAEVLAAGHDEPTLFEIYAHLARCGVLADAEAATRLAELEFAAERSVLRPVAAMRQLLAERPAGQALVFASDTVLPGAWLSTLLAEHGFGEDPAVFTSADTRRSKHTGRMYDHLAQAIGCATAEILHLGDNPQTDVANARAAGVQAIHLPAPRKPPEQASMAARHWFARVLDSRRRTLPPDHGLHRFATLLLVGFTLFTLAEARRRGIRRVYYLARDGYLPIAIAQRIIARRGWDIEVRYLYGSRQSLVVPAMAGDLPTLARRVADSMLDQKLGRMLELIGIDEARTGAMLRELGIDPERPYQGAEGLAAVERLFAAQAEIIGATLAALRRNALDYLSQEGFLAAGKRIVVDVGWRGSTQVALAALTGLPADDIIGCYMGLFADALRPDLHPGNAAGYLFTFGHPRPRYDLAREGYALFELFCSAPHATIARYEQQSGRMVQVEAHEAEPAGSVRRAALREIEAGVLAEVAALDAMLDGAWPEEIDAGSALAGIETLLTVPTQADVATINAVSFINGLNGGHNVRAANKVGLRRLVLDPEGALRQMRNSPWRAGAVRLALPWPIPGMTFDDLEHRLRKMARLLRLR